MNLQAQWIIQSPGTTNGLHTLFFANANTGWVAGSASTIYRTTNGGTSWTNISYPVYSVSMRGIYFLNNLTGWIAGDNFNTISVLIKTTDGGNSWLSQNPGSFKKLKACYFVNSSSGWVVGSNASGIGNILYTTNGGTSWTEQWIGGGELKCTYGSISLGSFGIAGGRNIIATTSNAGLSWDTAVTNFNATGIHMTSQMNGFASDSSGKIMKTVNGGNNWTVSFAGGLGNLYSIFFADANTGWACGSAGKILRTSNGGSSWFMQNVPTAQDFYSIFFITPTIGYAAGSGSLVTKTLNGGEVPENTITIHRYNIYKPIGPSQFTNDTVNFNSYVPNGGYTRYVKISLDTITNAVNSDLEISLIHQNKNDTIVYRVGGNGNNFFNTVLNDSALIPIENGVPPYNGQFKPSRPLSQFINLSSGGLWILKIYDRAKSLTGVIKSWSITVTYTPVIGINKIENNIPEKFELFQNYPNPFNPSTTIRFMIPKTSFVTLKVYDMLGRVVAELINENLKQGVYETPFTVQSNLSSGIYFYKITANDFSEVKRMVLIK